MIRPYVTSGNPVRDALQEVFTGYHNIDFDWYGWEGRARQALAGAPVQQDDGEPPPARRIAAAVLLPVPPPVAQPLDTWHEDMGPVVWWRFPITEEPYVGTPLDDTWTDDYYTHWTPLQLPQEPAT